MTDYQEEGNFIDVSNYSDEAIFDHEYLVGEPLKQVSEIYDYFKIFKIDPETFSQQWHSIYHFKVVTLPIQQS